MNHELKFLKSALSLENPFNNLEQFHSWIIERRNAITHNIEEIPLTQMSMWHFDSGTGNLQHDSGKFFSIEGIKVHTNYGTKTSWSQPIINQPEIGLLGIITKQINGILYFLMQAKIEPGNINGVQLSPTLQATKSNYTKVHKGSSPDYFEYFFDKNIEKVILLDQLQSEQGARFLRKRNRNIIIEIEEDIEIKENFCWLTLGQIQKLLECDNVVNMDTRTVISGISFGNYRSIQSEIFNLVYPHNASRPNQFNFDMLLSSLDCENYQHTLEEILSWLTILKSTYELDITSIPLKDVDQWHRDEYAIYHQDKKYFSVIGVNVEINSREVHAWSQPLVRSAQEGIIAFIVKKINGNYHFLVQAKLEAGNFDIIELAPTVQCLTGNYREGQNEYAPLYLDYVLRAIETGKNVKYKSYQSEEGGRFYNEQNMNVIIEAGDEFTSDIGDNFMWMTLNQLKLFIKFNNYLNIQARSLISALKFVN